MLLHYLQLLSLSIKRDFEKSEMENRKKKQMVR